MMFLLHILKDGGLYNSAVSIPSKKGLILQQGTNMLILVIISMDDFVDGNETYHHE